MARLVVGDVVVVPFPFADLTGSKRRPAVIVAMPEPGDDVVLCLITSRPPRDDYWTLLDESSFSSGGLRVSSYARANRLFTADAAIVASVAGRLSAESIDGIIGKVRALFGPHVSSTT